MVVSEEKLLLNAINKTVGRLGAETLVAVDPGDTTGVAVISYTKGAIVNVSSYNVAGGLAGFVDDWALLGWDPSVVVCEKFIVRPHFVGDSEALKIEGFLSGSWCGRVVFQQPSLKGTLFPRVGEAKRFGLLRELFPDGHRPSSHELDAVTHGLLWLRNRGHQPTYRLLKGLLEDQGKKKGSKR